MQKVLKENNNMKYSILDNQLQAEDFIQLFANAGWGESPEDMAETTLANSHVTFWVKKGIKVIAFVKLPPCAVSIHYHSLQNFTNSSTVSAGFALRFCLAISS